MSNGKTEVIVEITGPEKDVQHCVNDVLRYLKNFRPHGKANVSISVAETSDYPNGSEGNEDES